MTEPGPRAVPFYCPYCGEEDFVAHEDQPGTYVCGSCARHYVVRFLGLAHTRTEA